ncbi:MAG: hypothetical protein AABX88_00975 [Nanoarchaeota archaeon]
MALETILQHEVLTSFVYPFALLFFMVFAILEKTKLLGENKQLDALISFVIGLIFVSAFKPKLIVGNMILFLTVALVVMFVALLLWGFVSGGDMKSDILSGKIKWVFGIFLIITVVIAVLWASGTLDEVLKLLFKQSWSNTLWTNVAFVVAIAAALAIVMKD